ncbi:MAG: hypothetical protein LBV79_01695, partial [Candidatus Adiutrix sp.]|nr:hypothetical protein [Candidatus Adiutrix sp.]
MNTYPQDSAPQPVSLPPHFASLGAYEEWREDIEATATIVKKRIYPYAKEISDADEPPSLALLSPSSWCWRLFYYLLLFVPPIMLEPDRLLLENKNAQIQKYINFVDPQMKRLMMIDRGHIAQAFAFMEKAREKLRIKYPEFPLEYPEHPTNQTDGLILSFVGVVSLIFPVFLEALSKTSGIDFSVMFTYIPTAIVPTFAPMAAVSLKPMQTEIFLSYFFYYTFIVALLT